MDEEEYLLIQLLSDQLELMDPAYQMIRTTRYKVTDSIIRGLGSSEWNSLLKEFVGRFVVHKRGTPIDSFYQELSDMYPYLFSPDIWNDEDQFFKLIEFEREYRSINSQIKEISQ